MLIDLFDRLEKEKLVISFNPSQKHWVLGDDQFESNGVSLLVAIELRKKLHVLTRKEFRVSQSLHDLAENDYMSDEALRFRDTMNKERRTLRITQVALIISVLAQIPVWVQLFIDKTVKVELTPVSQAQTSILKDAPGQDRENPIEPANTDPDREEPKEKS